MKRIALIAITLLLLNSCTNELSFSTGFNTNLKNESYGNEIVLIDENVFSFSINGSVVVDSGYVKLYLIAPTADTIWKVIYTESKPVSETIETFEGKWKFGYIGSGKGTIKVNLSYK